MNKVIENKRVYFYDDNNNLIMYLDHSIDDCIWYFDTNEIIKITEDMELYPLISSFMDQDYTFNDGILKNYKDKNKLIWYSDCYYNPDDEWSVKSVSCLNIERIDNYFNIWCIKKLDEIIDRKNKTYGIAFAPAGNGVFSRNINTGLTLQNDFIRIVYQPLLKNKIRLFKYWINSTSSKETLQKENVKVLKLGKHITLEN